MASGWEMQLLLLLFWMWLRQGLRDDTFVALSAGHDERLGQEREPRRPWLISSLRHCWTPKLYGNRDTKQEEEDRLDDGTLERTGGDGLGIHGELDNHDGAARNGDCSRDEDHGGKDYDERLGLGGGRSERGGEQEHGAALGEHTSEHHEHGHDEVDRGHGHEHPQDLHSWYLAHWS